jgi:hypothetical protein
MSNNISKLKGYAYVNASSSTSKRCSRNPMIFVLDTKNKTVSAGGQVVGKFKSFEPASAQLAERAQRSADDGLGGGSNDEPPKEHSDKDVWDVVVDSIKDFSPGEAPIIFIKILLMPSKIGCGEGEQC